MALDVVGNPAIGAAGGAGIQAAQFVVERGAKAVVTGNVGPNAFSVFQAAEVPVYLFEDGTVREAVEAYTAGALPAAAGPSARAHAGMRMGRGRGMGVGMGRERGRGLGLGGVLAEPLETQASVTAPPAGEEIADLKQMASDLRGRLSELVDRLDRLETGGGQ
jgi:predicted Fe-Mo cluster-binding NifX family protein